MWEKEINTKENVSKSTGFIVSLVCSEHDGMYFLVGERGYIFSYVEDFRSLEHPEECCPAKEEHSMFQIPSSSSLAPFSIGTSD